MNKWPSWIAVCALALLGGCGDGAEDDGGGGSGQGGGAAASGGGAGGASGSAGEAGASGQGGSGGAGGSAGAAGVGGEGGTAGATCGACTGGAGGAGAEGSEPPPCRSNEDCPGDWLCRSPGYSPPPCRGAPCRSELGGCFGDGSCATEMRCSYAPDDLCGGMYRDCMAACTSNGDCALGLICDWDGHCLPMNHCSLGVVACPIHHVCDPDMPETDQGCRRLTCSVDAECADEGVCLFGRCHLTLGSCQPPPEPCLAP